MSSRNLIEIILQAQDKASSVLEKTASKLDDAGKKMVKATAPIAAGLGASVYVAAQFDSAMTDVGAILGQSADQMQELRAQVLALGGDSRAGPQAAAEAFASIVGGVADASTHMAILQASIAAAEAGNAELGSTTSALISIMNSYGYSADQASVISDILTQTVGMGVGSMEEFASALPAVTGLANSMGIEFADLAAASAYLTTQGNTASQSTTQLGGMMSALLNPSAKMKEALTELGYESGRAAVDQLGLVGTYQALIDKFGIDAVGPFVGQLEALRGVTALTDERFTEFSGTFTSTAEGLTASAREIQMDSATAQLDLLKSKMSEAGVEIGDIFIPHLVDLVNQVTPVIDSFVNWTRENPEAARTLMTVVAAVTIIGPLMVGLSTVITSVTTVAGFLSAGMGILTSVFGTTAAASTAAAAGTTAAGVAATGATAAAGGMGAAFMAAVGPILAVTAVIAGAIAAVQNFNNVTAEARGAAGDYVAANSQNITEQQLWEQVKRSAEADLGAGIMSDIVARSMFEELKGKMQPRALGGSVSGGSPYMVGEQGPELFVPPDSGEIIPNTGTGGISIGQIVIHASTQEGGKAAMAGALDEIRTKRLARGGA